MSVWCLIIDHDRTLLGVAFRVHCDPDLDVDALKAKLIAAESALQGFTPTRFGVYHSSTIKADMDFDDLTNTISKLDLSKARVNPTAVAINVASGFELLIIQKLAGRTSLKRPFVPSEVNEYELLQQSKVARLAPSDMAKASTYPSIQKDPKQRILDDRPTPVFNVAPIALLYLPFGEFKDTFASGVWPNSIYAIDLQKMEKNVNALAAAMALYYTTEPERRNAALPFLEAIFEFALRAVWEKALAGTHTFPHAQRVGYVAHSHVASDKVKNLCCRWQLPALGMTFVGDLIQFHAISLLGHQYRVVNLTPVLSFAAANPSGSSIIQRPQIKARPTPSPSQSKISPSVTKILKYGGNDADKNYIDFAIFDSVAGTGGETYHNRHLYRARLRDLDAQSGHACDSEILVKFSRRYSIDLHNFCSERGHAPTILGFEKLPDGWFAVAMHYLPDAAPITYLTPTLRRKLEALVGDFHSEGFVHGDLRAANIICNRSSESFWLIDFDWGGKEGEANYPTPLLNKELRSGRQARDLMIRKEDDIRILRATLDALESE